MSITYLTLEDAAKRYRGIGGNARINPRTVGRWCTVGVRGVLLKSALVAGRRCTTAEWLDEFHVACGEVPMHRQILARSAVTRRSHERARAQAVARKHRLG